MLSTSYEGGAGMGMPPRAFFMAPALRLWLACLDLLLSLRRRASQGADTLPLPVASGAPCCVEGDEREEEVNEWDKGKASRKAKEMGK